MSKNLLHRTLKQSSSSNANSLQKKIDPAAQLKWLNSQHGDQGFGIYGDKSLDNTDSEAKSGHDEGKKNK